MKVKLIMVISIFLLVGIMTGCGKRIKNEKELARDLSENSDFYMVEESEISKLTVIKRLTDEANKTDTVYVSVDVEHEAASKTCAYIMNYKCYNEGWMLDSITPYDGEEVVWKTTPKALPTNKEIEEALISYSKAKIDSDSEEIEGVSQLYFCEEREVGYTINIYPGTSTSDLSYGCIVETQSALYGDDVVTEMLWFYFDEYTYEWEISSSEIVDSYCSSETLDAGIVFISMNESEKQYQKVGQEALNAIFVDSNYSKLKQLWHPKMKQYLEQFDGVKVPEDCQVFIIPAEIVVEKVVGNDKYDEEEIKAFKKMFGENVKEGANCSYVLKAIYEDEVEYLEISLILVKEEGKIYIAQIDI